MSFAALSPELINKIAFHLPNSRAICLVDRNIYRSLAPKIYRALVYTGHNNTRLPTALITMLEPWVNLTTLVLDLVPESPDFDQSLAAIQLPRLSSLTCSTIPRGLLAAHADQLQVLDISTCSDAPARGGRLLLKNVHTLKVHLGFLDELYQHSPSCFIALPSLDNLELTFEREHLGATPTVHLVLDWRAARHLSLVTLGDPETHPAILVSVDVRIFGDLIGFDTLCALLPECPYPRIQVTPEDWCILSGDLSAANLPVELIDDVLSYLDLSSLQTMALLSSVFYEYAVPRVYRAVRYASQRIPLRPCVAAHVRCLTVCDLGPVLFISAQYLCNLETLVLNVHNPYRHAETLLGLANLRFPNLNAFCSHIILVELLQNHTSFLTTLDFTGPDASTQLGPNTGRKPLEFKRVHTLKIHYKLCYDRRAFSRIVLPALQTLEVISDHWGLPQQWLNRDVIDCSLARHLVYINRKSLAVPSWQLQPSGVWHSHQVTYFELSQEIEDIVREMPRLASITFQDTTVYGDEDKRRLELLQYLKEQRCHISIVGL
ncbi:hypothetical protein NP233_g11778 [Leucocoprinus birnbaumii]|uniref:F-box domain-containing protein n=1 Tax=Leucocoprinus birnbaumii TaxID=56174 RepID=A0AAD5VIC5_9AGAR|nr:hypothetical protein NP233_g11778 [Leucocoprinus birnbaumii]